MSRALWNDEEWKSYELCLRHIRTGSNPSVFDIPKRYRTTELTLEFIRRHPQCVDKVPLDDSFEYVVFLETMKASPMKTVERLCLWDLQLRQNEASIPVPFITLELCLVAVENDYTRLVTVEDKYTGFITNTDTVSLFAKFIPPNLIKPIKQVLIVRKVFSLMELGVSQNLMLMICDALEDSMFAAKRKNPIVTLHDRKVNGNDIVLVGSDIDIVKYVPPPYISFERPSNSTISKKIGGRAERMIDRVKQKLTLHELDCMVRIMKSL